VPQVWRVVAAFGVVRRVTSLIFMFTIVLSPGRRGHGECYGCFANQQLNRATCIPVAQKGEAVDALMGFVGGGGGENAAIRESWRGSPT
jgi:hypothetical protein